MLAVVLWFCIYKVAALSELFLITPNPFNENFSAEVCRSTVVLIFNPSPPLITPLPDEKLSSPFVLAILTSPAKVAFCDVSNKSACVPPTPLALVVNLIPP